MLLNDIRVIDLSQYIPGPYLTRMLADLGADVIKIEPPAGDPMRYFSSDKNEHLSAPYRYLNHGKKIVRLDLKTERGILKLKDLIAGADILIDGFRPGVMKRLGFEQQVLKSLNPRLIYCALTGYGHTGPYSQKAGHDLGYCAAAGLLSTHSKSRQPQIVYPPLADHVAPIQACNTILAALYAREKSGQGRFIDASLYEPLLSWHYLVKSEYISQVLGGDAAYYNIYQTADQKFVTLSALEKKFWQNFCEAVGRPEWINRHDEALPQTNLITELKLLFQNQNQAYWNELLADVDCCYEPVPEMDQILNHPQTCVRKTVDHYPNLVNDERLATTSDLLEFNDIENLTWS